MKEIGAFFWKPQKTNSGYRYRAINYQTKFQTTWQDQRLLSLKEQITKFAELERNRGL